MAVANPRIEFTEQISETRRKIKDRFKKSHEALIARENNLLSHVDNLESEYNHKMKLRKEISESLRNVKSSAVENLKANELTNTREQVVTLLDSKLTELTAETDSSIEFEWNNQFETDIEQLGSIKLNSQTNISPIHTFPPQVKLVVPDYKAKQLPTAYCCKNSDKKAPGELNCPRGIAIHYQTGNIYIADHYNNCVQVFSCNGDYLFMFSEKMNKPIGICISQNKVFVIQYHGHCINKYELEGKLIKSVGSKGNGEAQFSFLYGLDVSDRNSNVYVCESNNKRVQILTQELKFHSMLGISMFNHPRDVKVTRDRVLVLDDSDPCMFVFNSDHVLTNRLITKGDGKQTNNPCCFDIDRYYNIIMSDYSNHCVYIFNQEGEQIHKFGKEGEGIGEFINPLGIALDNTGHIIVIQLQSTSNTDKQTKTEDTREHSIKIEKLRDKILELEGKENEIRESLASTQLHTSRLLSPQEYTKLKQSPPNILPIQDQLRLFVYESNKILNIELENSKQTSDNYLREIETVKLENLSFKMEIQHLNQDNTKLQGELNESISCVESLRDQIKTGNHRLETYDQLVEERNCIRQDLEHSRRNLAHLEVDLKSRTDECRGITDEVITLRQTNSLLSQDKSYLSKHNTELGIRCEGLEDRLRGSDREVIELREARELLYDKFIHVRESFKSEFEKKLEEEVSSLRDRTENEINRLRGTTREMHEREISSERGAREGAVLDREQGRKELAELQSRHESILSEYRQLQMSTDSRVGQLEQELRITRFELEKTQLLQEEYLLNLKQSQVEVDKLRKKLDLSTQEFYAKDSEYAQYRAQLEARNAELAERLRFYDNLDKDMDQAVIDAAQIDNEEESKRVLGILGLYDTTVSRKGARALRQSAHLARQVLKLEKEKGELQHSFNEMEKKLASVTDRLIQAQENSELSKQPNSYLTDLLRSRDNELKECRIKVKNLSEHVEALTNECEQLKKSRSSLAQDLQRILKKREEIDSVKESVSALRESARIAMEQLGPDPKPVVFVNASNHKN
ncbi:Progesterone-induced-blocking factor 1 [Oopsacas minuta]|uniref:Progesterone-induced-blocking factor 1 n=1 Tax=Oopsacas minuta TaxID=111878 RepID=A0AAV7KH54_9METZ|nr:Progesterone-induced-blocking factor 1 [Oopsacas minuta]